MTSIRRPHLALVTLVLGAMLAALFGAVVSAETPTASVPVTVTATVDGHTYSLGQSISGLSDGDVVDVHVDAQSPPNPTASSIFGLEGRECADVSVSNSFDFTPTQGGNCSNVALGSGSLHPVVAVGPPDAVADMDFTVGEGTTTFQDEDLDSHTITCEDTDTCKLVILLQVPSATDFVSFPITFGTPATAPGAPTGVAAAAHNQQASVSWTAPSSTGGAAITGYTATASPGGQTCTTATLTCTVAGLDNFTPYTFTVKATNAASLTSLASAPSGAVTPRPAPPAITDATAGDAQATLVWSAASPAPTSYTVTSAPGSKTCTTSSLTCAVTGLTNGTGYTFTVTATYPGGTAVSGASSVVTPTQAPGPPSPPTGVSATAGNQQASVSWTAPTDSGGSAVTGYAVTSSPGSLSCTAAITSCTVTGLSNFTGYTFTVKATNAGSFTSAASSASSSVTPLPSAPAVTGTTPGDAQVALVWSAASPPPTGYTVTSSPGALTCTTASLGCTVSGLTNGTGYTFTVKATYDGGSVTSAPSSLVTPEAPPGPPAAPTGVSASAGNSQATVSWTAPSDTGNATLTGYTVISSPGGVTCTTASTSCTVTGLSNFTGYTFTVTATNSASFTSTASSASSSVTPLPAAPSITSALGGDGQATITWSAANPAPTSYTVTSSPGGLTCTTSSGSCTVTGLTDGTGYTFTVKATYGAGSVNSGPSSSVTPVAPVAPGAPTDVTATPGDGQATVSWTAPASDGGSAITSYTVSATPSGAPDAGATPSSRAQVDVVSPPSCTTATTSCTVTGLANFTAYTFTVTATNGFPLTSASSVASPAITPVPTAPVITSVTPGDGTATVVWSASDPAATGYTVTATPGGATCTTTTATTCAVTGLADGTPYTFVVTATFADGTDVSAPSAAATPAAPTTTTSASPVSATPAATAGTAATAATDAPDGTVEAATTTLPVTGSPALPWLIELGAVLLGLGVLLVAAARRRHPVGS